MFFKLEDFTCSIHKIGQMCIFGPQKRTLNVCCCFVCYCVSNSIKMLFMNTFIRNYATLILFFGSVRTNLKSMVIFSRRNTFSSNLFTCTIYYFTDYELVANNIVIYYIFERRLNICLSLTTLQCI